MLATEELQHYIPYRRSLYNDSNNNNNNKGSMGMGEVVPL